MLEGYYYFADYVSQQKHENYDDHYPVNAGKMRENLEILEAKVEI